MPIWITAFAKNEYINFQYSKCVWSVSKSICALCTHNHSQFTSIRHSYGDRERNAMQCYCVKKKCLLFDYSEFLKMFEIPFDLSIGTKLARMKFQNDSSQCTISCMSQTNKFFLSFNFIVIANKGNDYRAFWVPAVLMILMLVDAFFHFISIVHTFSIDLDFV